MVQRDGTIWTEEQMHWFASKVTGGAHDETNKADGGPMTGPCCTADSLMEKPDEYAPC